LRDFDVALDLLARSQTALLAGGERARAEELWQELEELGSRTKDATVLLWPLYNEAIRLTLDGNLEAVVEARKCIADRADELGVSVAGRLRAEHLIFRPLLYLGRAEEALANHQEAERLVGVKVFSTASRIGWSGLCLGHMGRFAEAQTQLTEYLRQLNITAKEDEIPAPIFVTLLEIAVLVGDKEAAAVLSKRLAGVVAIPTTSVTVTSVALHVGRAAVLRKDWEGARANYDKALAWATKISHRPEVALTRFGLAEMLLTKAEHAKGDAEQTAGALRSEAQTHLDFAISEFQAMKMKPALEQALRHKGLLTA
jgi:tetratricopeptide (TPR) repeat protein